MEMDSIDSAGVQQHVLVMRHGDRIDNFVDSWLTNASRPWDPPLIDAGRDRAFRVATELRTQLGFPIHRVVVSPFMRCVETASEVVSALCAVDDSHNTPGTKLRFDPAKIKASVELGIGEMLNSLAIGVPPEDGDWGFDLRELELKLPVGTVDHEYEPVVKELPRWEESTSDARDRFGRVIHALADKYPSENLLLITHGSGIRAAVRKFLDDTRVHGMQYCAYVELQRQVFLNDNSLTSKKFHVVSHQGY